MQPDRSRQTLRAFTWIAVIGISWASLSYVPGRIDSHMSLAAASYSDDADLMCSEKFDPNMFYYQYDRTTKKWGLLGRLCEETTASGSKIEGYCTALNKCKATSIDGKTLPGLPPDSPSASQEQTSSFEDFSATADTYGDIEPQSFPLGSESVPAAQTSRINESFDELSKSSMDRVLKGDTFNADVSLQIGLQSRAQELNLMTEYHDSDTPDSLRESDSYKDLVRLSSGITPETKMNISDIDSEKTNSILVMPYKPESKLEQGFISSQSTFVSDDQHFYDSFRRSENVEVQTKFGRVVSTVNEAVSNMYEKITDKVSGLWSGIFSR